MATRDENGLEKMPSRKPERNDSQWVADLFAHGLIKPSYVPPLETRDLRELTGHGARQH